MGRGWSRGSCFCLEGLEPGQSRGPHSRHLPTIFPGTRNNRCLNSLLSLNARRVLWNPHLGQSELGSPGPQGLKPGPGCPKGPPWPLPTPWDFPDPSQTQGAPGPLLDFETEKLKTGPSGTCSKSPLSSHLSLPWGQAWAESDPARPPELQPRPLPLPCTHWPRGPSDPFSREARMLSALFHCSEAPGTFITANPHTRPLPNLHPRLQGAS